MIFEFADRTAQTIYLLIYNADGTAVWDSAQEERG